VSRKRIDMAMLRTKVRGLSHGTIFEMLDDALDLLPPARLEQLVGRYLRHDDLRPIAGGTKRDSPSNLRTDVEEFAVASRRGDYFEAFDVNSKNCTEQSNGTMAWIAECNRLLDRCVALSTRKRDIGDVAASFEVLFDLIDDAGSFDFDIVFFADEGGTYEFGIRWSTVMEAWFVSFALHSSRDGSYKQRVAAIIERGGELAGEAHQRMARTVRNRKPPPTTGR